MSAKFIESVFTAQDDQISSQYRLSVVGADPRLTYTTDSWVFRMDKNFTVPPQVTNTYETHFNGLKIPKVGAKEETDKKIKLDFRADQSGEIYSYFKTWVDQGFSPINAFMESESTTRRNKNIKVDLLKRGTAKSAGNTSDVQKTFTFYHVQPFEVMMSELNHETGEPVRIELQFIYLYYDIT